MIIWRTIGMGVALSLWFHVCLHGVSVAGDIDSPADTAEAGTENVSSRAIGIVIFTDVDKDRSDSAAIEHTFKHDTAQDTFLASLATDLKFEMETAFERLELKSLIEVGDRDWTPPDTMLVDYRIVASVILDQNGFVRLSITADGRPSQGRGFSISSLKITDTYAETIGTNQESASRSIAGEVGPILARLLVENVFKARVIVESFEQSSSVDTLDFLALALRDMVQAELAKSQAFILYSQDSLSGDSLVTNPEIFANYAISGSYFVFGDGLRADIFCKKISSQRVLLSEKIQLEPMSLYSLSDQLTHVAGRLKAAILADFQQTRVSIAVVAAPPRRYLTGGRRIDNVQEIAKITRLNVSNKLRRVVKYLQSSNDSIKVDVIEDSPLLDKYVDTAMPPGEILNELSVDYLLLLGTYDLGQKVRMTVTVYSYSHDPPLIAEPIFAGTAYKSRFVDLVDEAIIYITSRLHGAGVIPGNDHMVVGEGEPGTVIQYPIESENFVDSGLSRLGAVLAEAHIQDIRKNKGLGLRIGGAVHEDPNLYLGKKTTEYLEAFFVTRMPTWHKLPAFLESELELSIGMDYGAGSIFRQGATTLFLLATSRIVATVFPSSDLPVTIAGGPGVGIAAISYKFNPEEDPYAGDTRLEDAAVKFVTVLSGTLEIPVTGWLRLQVAPKYHFDYTDNVDDFVGAQFNDDVPRPIIGRLNGWHILAGFRVVFR